MGLRGSISSTGVREAGIAELTRLSATLADAFIGDPVYRWLTPTGDGKLEASSERSASLYERLGFIHLGEVQVTDGPRLWPMRRPPASA